MINSNSYFNPNLAIISNTAQNISTTNTSEIDPKTAKLISFMKEKGVTEGVCHFIDKVFNANQDKLSDAIGAGKSIATIATDFKNLFKLDPENLKEQLEQFCATSANLKQNTQIFLTAIKEMAASLDNHTLINSLAQLENNITLSKDPTIADEIKNIHAIFTQLTQVSYVINSYVAEVFGASDDELTQLLVDHGVENLKFNSSPPDTTEQSIATNPNRAITQNDNTVPGQNNNDINMKNFQPQMAMMMLVTVMSNLLQACQQVTTVMVQQLDNIQDTLNCLSAFASSIGGATTAYQDVSGNKNASFDDMAGGNASKSGKSGYQFYNGHTYVGNNGHTIKNKGGKILAYITYLSNGGMKYRNKKGTSMCYMQKNSDGTFTPCSPKHPYTPLNSTKDGEDFGKYTSWSNSPNGAVRAGGLGIPSSVIPSQLQYLFRGQKCRAGSNFIFTQANCLTYIKAINNMLQPLGITALAAWSSPFSGWTNASLTSFSGTVSNIMQTANTKLSQTSSSDSDLQQSIDSWVQICKTVTSGWQS